MPWTDLKRRHDCRTPGDFRIWLRRADRGSTWTCGRCEQQWVLHRRTPVWVPAYWLWERSA